MKLDCYLTAQGRGSVTWLAEQINDHPENVSMYRKNRKQVPAGRCVQIEAATKGQVTRKDLRPDDWYLIWPELIDRQ